MKQIGIFLLAAALLLAFMGCRVRTTAMPAATPVVIENTAGGQTTPDPSAAPTPAPESKLPDAAPTAAEETEPDENAPTEEDPTSERREYSDNADAELTPDADTPVLAPVAEPTDASAAPSPDADADGDNGESMETDGADRTATETVPADEASDLGASDNAPVADTLLTYYQTLLCDRVSSLFECRRLYVYWETQTDHTTVFKDSAEHRLILDAGAYDVSARLLEENLTVDAEWIQNKNPGMIVKVVSQDILGGGMQSKAPAQAVMDALLAREGISGTDAAKNGSVLLLSEELLTTQAGRTAAEIYLAKAMYPELFADVDPDEALRLLTKETDGDAADGVFAYAG